MSLFLAPHPNSINPQSRLWSALLLFAVLACGSTIHAQTNTNKWLQIPDTSNNGLDVRDLNPNPLADDFLCTATGPITQVRIWGSWSNNLVPPATSFNVAIMSDFPAQGGCPSSPNFVLCTNTYFAGQYTFFPYTNGVFEQFVDPQCGFPVFIGADTIIWEYVFDLTNSPCWQTNGNIYWLVVSATGFNTNNFSFGWKTCPTNWNDAATVYNPACPFICPLSTGWNPLRRPPGFNTNLDLAF